MQYPHIAKELKYLLDLDQRQKRRVGREYFASGGAQVASAQQRARADKRTDRAKHLLSLIGLPRITAVGVDGVRALAVLLSHGDTMAVAEGLAAFEQAAAENPADTVRSIIPALKDISCVLAGTPQIFGTVWLFEQRSDGPWPFLYPVEDQRRVDDLRRAYDLGALAWPRSLAVPLTEQPWLATPLESSTMRWPTNLEYRQLGFARTSGASHCEGCAA